MKILLISAGLPGKRSGGLPAYLGEIMEELLARGHQLHYLDTSGRDSECKGIHYETIRRHDGLSSTQFFNLKALPDYGRGTMDPLAQAQPEPAFLKQFEQWGAGLDIDLVHIHEFIGFPVEALSFFFRRHIPVMATMHDFYALCPTVRLMLPDGRSCNLRTPELVCRQCCRQGVSRVEEQAASWMQRIRDYRGGSWLAGAVWPRVRPFLRWARWWVTNARSYRIRREDLLSILRQLDLICGNSKQTADLYRQIGGLENVVADTTFTCKSVRHTASLRSARVPGKPLRILVLNVRRDHKGLGLLKRELALLSPQIARNLRFLAWGCSPIESPLVDNRGPYEGDQLDTICAEADMGLVPSVWREAYGFVGAEMLSRGLPVIASQPGAMKEYIEEGRDGLLFDPLKPGDLARVLSRLAEDGELQRELAHNASDGWKKFATFGVHVDKLIQHYEQIVNRRAQPSQVRP